LKEQRAKGEGRSDGAMTINLDQLMKAGKIGAIICGVFVLPCTVFGQENASPTNSSIDGEWVITFQAQGKSVSGSLHFKTDGERVTGTVETAHTGPGTVQNGKWSQQKITATLVFQKHEDVLLEGELKSDGTLGGDYHTEGRTDKWRAVRSMEHGAKSIDS
jgi:hypothetical protein